MSVAESTTVPVAADLLVRALTAQRQGQVEQAAQLYRELLELQPDQPDALHFIGVIDFQQGRIAQGCARIEAAVAQKPAPEFLSNLGTVYLAQNRLADALRVLVRAVELAPDNPACACNLAVALTQAKDYTSAVALARKVLARHPGHAAALNVVGNASRLKGDFAAGQAAFAELVERMPQDPDAHYNLGVVLQDLWDMTGARAAYERAIALKGDVARYHVNHGAALMKLHEITLAGQSYARALALEPDLAEAHYNYAICQFLQGNLRDGAQHYDWRLKIDEQSLSRPRDMTVPMWDGVPAPDKTVLLHSEQGLGDMLQFIRFAPAVAAMVGRVIVEVPKPIVRLLQEAFPDLTIVAKGSELPPYDLHCPLMSLMKALQLEQDDLPATMFPYFRAQPDRVARWKEKLSGKPGRLIAISWQGNPKAKVDRGRSMPLAMLAPLLAIPGLRFISLQKNDGAEQVAALPPQLRARIEVLDDSFDAGPDGFLDTAAVMMCCDLVLTTDTAIAHVAGALNRPTWLMLKKTPDWRWLLERTDSPWYPSMRLFRQREDGNWQTVVAALARELQPGLAGLGEALAAHQAGRLDEAEAGYRRILAAQADEPVARHHLGVIALQRGQHDVAETQIREALRIRPDDADALANLALALKGQGRLEEAVATCRQVLALVPHHSATHNNLANLLKVLGRSSEAITHYRQAVTLAPGKADLLHNLGLALLESGQLREAEVALAQALRQAPDNADYHFDHARCLLMQGRWAEGWAEYEWRRRMGEFGAVSDVAGPRWDGTANSQLVLLVHAEQGLGDAIQFVRFARAARARVGRLVLVVPPRLKALLGSAPGVDEVYSYGEQLPPYHAQVPLLSLPQVLQAVPAPVGAYLQSDAARLARWQVWRAGMPGKLIGLNWQGNPKARADAGRSLQLAQLAALGEVPGVTFVALQKGAALEQVADLPSGFPLVTPPSPFDEEGEAFLDTAALMQCCDLVITTDTSVAHLAGALDRPCWVLLKHAPDWRWMAGRTDSPWYGRMRLFRQPAPGAWDSVVESVRQALLAGETGSPLDQAVALHKAGRLAEAEAAYADLLAQDPDQVMARHYLGVALHQQGRSAEGEQEIRRALEARPDYAEAWGNLALTLKVQDRIREAEAAFDKALTLNPDSADVRNNFGNLLNGTGRHEFALEQYRQAIRLQPGRADGYSNAGSALGDLERYDEAVENFRRALALRPDYVGAMLGLGKALRSKGETDAALAVFREAVTVEPENADAWSNLGVCYRELSRYDEALTAYDHALRLKPDHAECWSNRAIALHYTARFDEAESAYRDSLRLKPDRADAHFGLAAVQLTRGHWLDGWQEYEWRRQMKESGPVRTFAQPLWDGRPAPDRTLFLFVEQGLGDTLQFIRFLPLVQALVGRVVLEVQPGLHRLVSPALPGVDVIRQGERLPSFDVYAPLMSLPGLLGMMPETLPAPPAYLAAEPDLVRHWAERLPKGGLRVGLNWQGNPKASVDKGRSVPLACLAPVLQVEGVAFVSLQKNAGAEQIDQLPPALRARIHTLGPEFDAGKDAFIDTAAVMASLDLVITTDTAMAHLAGALGRPCWTMLKFMPDWRWLFGRVDCPWYPATRLVRQPREGDWEAVADMVAAELAHLLA